MQLTLPISVHKSRLVECFDADNEELTQDKQTSQKISSLMSREHFST